MGMDRRKFFKSVTRGGIFSAMAVLSGYLVLRKKPEGTQECDFDFVCRNCNKNRYCKLPEASQFRMKKRQKL